MLITEHIHLLIGTSPSLDRRSLYKLQPLLSLTVAQMYLFIYLFIEYNTQSSNKTNKKHAEIQNSEYNQKTDCSNAAQTKT